MLKYHHAGIAGKFRLIHKAHVELILKAMSLTENLHIFIVDLPTYKRYAMIDQLINSFQEIFISLGFTNYHIHIIQEDLSGRSWDEKILSLVPELEVMFDSKETYGNILVKNEFIQLHSNGDISVSNIEKDPFERDNFYLISNAFRKYMTKKLVITGKPGVGSTVLTQKLVQYYDVTSYTRFNEIYHQIDDCLSCLNATFLENSVYAAVETIPNRMHLINDDPIKLLYVLENETSRLVYSGKRSQEELRKAKDALTAMIPILYEHVDYYLYCTNNREDDVLLPRYQAVVAPEKLVIIEATDYNNLFDAAIKTINNLLQIEN